MLMYDKDDVKNVVVYGWLFCVHMGVVVVRSKEHVE